MRSEHRRLRIGARSAASLAASTAVAVVALGSAFVVPAVHASGTAGTVGQKERSTQQTGRQPPPAEGRPGAAVGAGGLVEGPAPILGLTSEGTRLASASASGGSLEPLQAARSAARSSALAMEALIRRECRRDDECRVLPVGQRSCGGPAGFRAYSSTASDVPALHQAARRHARAQAKLDEAEGAMSTCEVLPEPTAACIRPVTPEARDRQPDAAGLCELRPGAGSGLR